MPGLDAVVWSPRRDREFAALVVHVGERTRFAAATARDTGISVPMLLDIEALAFVDYSQAAVGNPPFPLGYLIDREGVIRQVVPAEELAEEEWAEMVDALLDE